MGKKRFAAALLCAMLAFTCILFAGCQKNEGGLTKVRLNEVARSVFYAPMYVAITEGYFEEEGIEIELVTGQGATNVMTAITSKNADIGLMGPEATVYVQAEGMKNYPIIFAQLTQRDGSFLVAKTEQPNFKWTDLVGKHVLAGRGGGMPAMTMEYIVTRQYDMKTSEMNFNTSVEFADMGPTFVGDNSVDYTTLFEPTASDFVEKGHGYIVASVGEESGDIPYTAFSASKSYIEDNPAIIKGFIRAIIKGYHYVMTANATDAAKAMQPFFTGIDLRLLQLSVERYGEIEAWCDSPYFSEDSYIKLQDVMQNAGRLDKRVPYTSAVDNTYVNAVIAESK